MQALFDPLSEADRGEGATTNTTLMPIRTTGESIRRCKPFSIPSARQITAKGYRYTTLKPTPVNRGKGIRRCRPFSIPSVRQITAKGYRQHDPTFIYTIASWPADVKRVRCRLISAFTVVRKDAFTVVRKEGLIFGSERGIVSTIQTKALEETRK